MLYIILKLRFLALRQCETMYCLITYTQETFSENVKFTLKTSRGDVTAPSNLPSSGQHKNNTFHQNGGKLCQITCMTSILMWRNFETVRRWGKENGEKRRVL